MPAYQRRLLQIPYPQIKNPDGSVSTHEMAADMDAAGNWYAYPTIQQDDKGLLRRYPQKEAMKRAMQQSNFKAFGTDKDAALKYAQGQYKNGTYIEDLRRRR